MLTRGKMDRGVVEIVDTESLVPNEHLLRKIDKAVNWEQLYNMVEDLYCEDNGRPGVDPIVLFKLVLLQHLYGLSSLRRTADEVGLNVAYRWFLGYTLNDETPHFSTISHNFRHRFTKLKFASMNLKKLANWKWRTSFSCFIYSLFWPVYPKNPAYANA